jgi:hypothetical protein
MIYTIACYHDVDTGKFNPPMLFPFDKESVVETVKEGCLKGKIEGCEAFELMYLGTYDTASAKFDLVSSPELLFKCTDYVRKSA